jgi:hypothetical protein
MPTRRDRKLSLQIKEPDFFSLDLASKKSPQGLWKTLHPPERF